MNASQTPEELFATFLARARRAAVQQWWLQSTLRGLIAAAAMLTLLIGFRAASTMYQSVLVSTAVGAVVAAGNLWNTRHRFTGLEARLDGEMAAEGRISAAAEFLADAPSDPFKRLAVAEAGVWVAKRADLIRLWKTPVEAFLLPAAAGLVVAIYFWRA